MGTLVAKMDKLNEMQVMILPAMQTGRNPNLLTNPPTIGPDIRYTPHSRLPTQETVPASASKYLHKGVRRTPKEYAIPSRIILQRKLAAQTTHPQPPSGGDGRNISS